MEIYTYTSDDLLNIAKEAQDDGDLNDMEWFLRLAVRAEEKEIEIEKTIKL
ncbi:MAG: hypothetical protein WAV41_02345 [Microgenomates group bacterium]